jgi:hypothetical protein
MSAVVKIYELLKDLPLYPAGTLITHTYEVLPSKFNDGTYATDGDWKVDNVMATQYLVALVKWCVTSQRRDDNHTDWVQLVASPQRTEGTQA